MFNAELSEEANSRHGHQEIEASLDSKACAVMLLLANNRPHDLIEYTRHGRATRSNGYSCNTKILRSHCAICTAFFVGELILSRFVLKLTLHVLIELTVARVHWS